VNQHAVHTDAGQRFQGLQGRGKCIGNRDLDTARHCLYHLAVQVLIRALATLNSRSASLLVDRFSSFY